MIRLDVEQGSAAWIQARLGIPTASQFHRILTPKTLRVSEAASGYRNELLAEWLLGEPASDELSQFVQRGTVEESAARRFYELERDVDVEPVGFLLTDDRRAGCSPDGFVGQDGGLELKVPSASVHVGYLLEAAGDKYKAQIQGNLWISEREWWDFVSYHPSLPPALVRFSRDEVFIAALRGAVSCFCDGLDAAKDSLRARGCEPALEAVLT